MNGTSFLSKLPSCTALPTTKEKRKSDSIKIVKITFGVSRSTTTAGSRCTMITKWFPIYGIKSWRIASFCLVLTRAKVFTAVVVVLGEGEGNLLHLFTLDRVADFCLKKIHENFHGCDGNLKQISDQLEGYQLNTWLDQCFVSGKCVTEVAFHDSSFSTLVWLLRKDEFQKSCHGSDILSTEQRQPCTHKHHYA